MSDMRAGPSALPSPGSWQFEFVREQTGIWIGKSPCMLPGRYKAKREKETSLRCSDLLGSEYLEKERRAGMCCFWELCYVLLLLEKTDQTLPGER